MPTLYYYILYASVFVLATLTIRNYLKSKQLIKLLLSLFLLGLVLLFVLRGPLAPTDTVAKSGSLQETLFLVALYLFMVFGMLSHYMYTFFMKEKAERKKFDLGVFLAPVFASPLIFIPLLGAFQQANVDLQENAAAKYMIFLVAYENGFFWREYFSNRQKETSKGKEEKSSKNQGSEKS